MADSVNELLKVDEIDALVHRWKHTVRIVAEPPERI